MDIGVRTLMTMVFFPADVCLRGYTSGNSTLPLVFDNLKRSTWTLRTPARIRSVGRNSSGCRSILFIK